MSGNQMRVLNVKVPDELRDQCEAAAKLAGSPSLSQWLREALEAGATAEMAAAARADRAKVVESLGISGTQGRISSSGCVHPTPAHRSTPEAVVCGLCQAVVKWLL